MEEGLSVEQRFLALDMVIVGDATINRAYGGTLRFLMETLALGAFARNDIVDIVRDRRLRGLGINCFARRQYHLAPKRGTVLVAPVIGTLVNRGVWAFRLAGAAVDAFVGDDDGHVESM